MCDHFEEVGEMVGASEKGPAKDEQNPYRFWARQEIKPATDDAAKPADTARSVRG